MKETGSNRYQRPAGAVRTVEMITLLERLTLPPDHHVRFVSPIFS
jgi:hypothetical protein